jgi:membrane fusion protein
LSITFKHHMSFFRPEVMQSQASQWLGVVRLHRPLSFGIITASAVGVALLCMTFATWGEVNRKARVSGLLVSSLGSLNIAAPLAGVLVESKIVEGQTVQAGDVLLVLNTERQSAAGDTNALTLLHIEARKQTLSTERGLRQLQTSQRSQVLEDRIRTLNAELLRLDDEQTLLDNRITLSKKTLLRNQTLAAEGFLSTAQVQTTQEELIDLQSRQQAQARSKLSTQRDLRTLMGEAEGLATQLKADLNQLDRSVEQLNQETTETTARKSTIITAPYAGVVSAYNLQNGQAVQAGQTLATLLRTEATSPEPLREKVIPKLSNYKMTTLLSSPKEAVRPELIIPVRPEPFDGLRTGSVEGLQAHLYAPSRTAGFLKPGQHVYMRYAAYPYQKFGLQTGQITAISATPFAASELPPNIAQQLMAQAGSNEALYRINVQLDHQTITSNGEPLQLKAGLTLEADVLQERRKVWEWVLEPLLAARAQLKVLNSNPTPTRGG